MSTVVNRASQSRFQFLLNPENKWILYLKGMLFSNVSPVNEGNGNGISGRGMQTSSYERHLKVNIIGKGGGASLDIWMFCSINH